MTLDYFSLSDTPVGSTSPEVCPPCPEKSTTSAPCGDVTGILQTFTHLPQDIVSFMWIIFSVTLTSPQYGIHISEIVNSIIKNLEFQRVTTDMFMSVLSICIFHF
jgi:hypothetical protein